VAASRGKLQGKYFRINRFSKTLERQFQGKTLKGKTPKWQTSRKNSKENFQGKNF